MRSSDNEMTKFEGSNGTTFFYGGSAGYVKVIEPGEDERELLIPFEDIKGFIADCVRKEKILELEESSDDNVLGVSTL